MTSTAQAAIAALPILTILVLMLGLRWSAAKAGLVGLAVTFVVAWGVFNFGGPRVVGVETLRVTSGSLFEAVVTAASILWIIFPALCIHHAQIKTGAIDTLKAKMASLSSDRRISAILIVWFFALFLEGLAGFGTPVALAAPLLVSLGFSPVEAVALALIGHSVGVSFGAVGTPIVPQVASTGFDGFELARATGLTHALLGWIMLFLAMSMVNRSGGQERGGDQQSIWGWTALAAASFLIPYLVLSRWLGPELPTLGGALVGGLAFVAILKWRAGRSGSVPVTRAVGPTARAERMLIVTAPYAILVALILLTRLIPAVRESLSAYTWEWELIEGFRGGISPLYHPGSMLMMGFVAGAMVQRASFADIRSAMAEAGKKLGPVTIALLAMLSLSRIMIHSGMIDSLSTAAAETTGAWWPLVAPMAGVLGTFVTGSATASNILLTDFQQGVARNLDLPVLTIIGAQGFGAAVGNIICPHNIVAGGATVGLAGQEGKVLRRTIGACAIYSVFGGVVTLLRTW